MSNAVLQALQKNWGIPTAEDLARAPATEDAPAPNLQPSPVPAGEAGPVESLDEEDEFSCEWIGRNIVGRISEDPEKDAARLEYLMRHYPIRPHLNEGGGSGFEHPHNYEWSQKHDHLVSEFSDLWFTKAGDIIIQKYGSRMEVKPPPKRFEDYAREGRKRK